MESSIKPRLSANNSRNNIFRKIAGERKQDYVTDAPMAAPARANPLQFAAHLPKRNSSTSPMDASEVANNLIVYGNYMPPPRKGFLSRIGITSKHRYHIELLLRSTIWRFVMFFFILVLLFGAPVRDFLPKENDSVFDVLFMATFVLFTVDSVLRSIVNPHYCSLWSILFWCDVISTLFVLCDISYISPWNRTREVIIRLNEFGIPDPGLRLVSSHSWIAPSPIAQQILVVIGKSARISRLVRSSVVSKVSAKVNWFWFLQLLNPFWVYKSCSQKRRGLRHSSAYEDSDGESTSLTSSHFIQPTRPSRENSSWGNLGQSILSVVKAKRLAKEAEELKAKSFLGKAEKWLRGIGVLPPNDQEWRRHLAATKIQRCWRKAVKGWETEQALTQHNHYDGWGDDEYSRGGPNGMGLGSSDKSFPVASSHHRVAPERPAKSLLPRNKKKRKKTKKSQVGSAMRELTAQRVTIIIILALVFSVLFTFLEFNLSRESTMVMLHGQTAYPEFSLDALDSARASSIREIRMYKFSNDTYAWFNNTEVVLFDVYHDEYGVEERVEESQLREREMVNITVAGYYDNLTTMGLFSIQKERQSEAIIQLACTVFILLVWLYGMTAFTGPVMLLVVIPIERMVRLLGMLMVDPLGYQSSARYKKFVDEEDELTKNTQWSNEVLKGMETSFLMSTILRIGSLMKVGFGSAGVEIIRQNLERGQSRSKNIIGSQGSKVFCIFLFCDIRQFTDATESLQEEVFRFTNQIATVVHSYCHLYGGSANKNVGDAFLLSWILDSIDAGPRVQADKALISVVRICMALYYDNFYIETISETAKNALLGKIAKRTGPVVQMGFGLHAGEAVQGAIGSERKIDATYLSEAVEMAEFLESSTKKYGLKMLMSDTFHRLLDYYNRRRCRKIDQIVMTQDDDEDGEEEEELVRYDLLTLDLDIDALWQLPANKKDDFLSKEMDHHDVHDDKPRRDSKRMVALGKQQSKTTRQSKKGIQRINIGMLRAAENMTSDELFIEQATGGGGGGGSSSNVVASVASPIGGVSSSGHLNHDVVALGDGGVGVGVGGVGVGGENNNNNNTSRRKAMGKLELPKGQQMYRDDLWKTDDMRTIRKRYADFFVIKKYHAGLRSFYSRDWNNAKQCFQAILDRFEDGPSRYFMDQIESHGGKPPKGFVSYARA